MLYRNGRGLEMADPKVKTDAELLQQEDARYDRFVLSAVAGLLIGFFGLVTGLVWEGALGKSGSGFAWKIAGLSTIWGVVAVQQKSPGGALTDNRATANYATVGFYAWIAFLLSVLAFFAWVFRTLVHKAVR